MANSSITLAVVLAAGLIFIIIGCFYTLFSLIAQRFSSPKKELPNSPRKRTKFPKKPPIPDQRARPQNTRANFSGFLAFLLILSLIPALYVHIFDHKEEKYMPPPVESPINSSIPEWFKTKPSKEGKQWNIVVPKENVEPSIPKKSSSKKQRSDSYHTQKTFVIELSSFSSKEQAYRIAKSFNHPTKVISMGNEFKVLIGDFDTLLEADNYLQKSQLTGFVYQIRTHNAIGRKI